MEYRRLTTEAVSNAIVPSRDAWRSLLWFAPLTALWILLIYRWPAIPASGVPTTTHQLAAGSVAPWPGSRTAGPPRAVGGQPFSDPVSPAVPGSA